jgi:hypothetical protein
MLYELNAIFLSDSQTPPKPFKELEDMSIDDLKNFGLMVRLWELGPGRAEHILGSKFESWKLLDVTGRHRAIKKLLTESEYTAIYGRQPGQVFSRELDNLIGQILILNRIRTLEVLADFWTSIPEDLDNPAYLAITKLVGQFRKELEGPR